MEVQILDIKMDGLKNFFLSYSSFMMVVENNWYDYKLPVIGIYLNTRILLMSSSWKYDAMMVMKFLFLSEFKILTPLSDCHKLNFCAYFGNVGSFSMIFACACISVRLLIDALTLLKRIAYRWLSTFYVMKKLFLPELSGICEFWKHEHLKLFFWKKKL